MSGLWLRPYTSVPRPRLRLVCFPHAGGAASAFRTWPRYLPDDVELLAACYPGRENRLDERPVDRMDVLVERLAEVMLPLLNRPIALFGHSMGATVAHELAIRLGRRPNAELVGLFVSGRVPPHRLRSFAPDELGDEESLIAEVRRLGHDNLALYEDPEIRDMILPAVAADYRVVASYPPGPRETISIPVTAYGGDRDPDVSADDLRAWAATTSGPFEHRVLPGGHFYLRAEEKPLVEDISARLRTPTAPNSAEVNRIR
ncbi:thioesterase II family protein [Actinomadura bangladeshensis]|uniref:thioesterase II family protein n=1 Tax=Actinomadura bangladeshensis TaxID=453573 RepID=UPI001945A929|nr:alpha/beta fold hydrolase [Actinomadura bangladeshensis]